MFPKALERRDSDAWVELRAHPCLHTTRIGFQTGYLVPAGDEETMAAKVKKLLDDKALRQSMSKAGREETEKWSWEAATSVLRNVQYQKVRRREDGEE